MKLREKTNEEICKDNNLPFEVLSNIVEEKNTKNKMRATSDLIAKALTATLGPYGSSTIIQDRDGNHFATKDGYDLMSRLSFEDEVSKTILDLFKKTAASQVFTVGDGSTSAIIVANALFQTLTDKAQVEHFSKISPKDIVDILNDIGDDVEEYLKKMAKPISDDMRELDTIAAVANNNDINAGKMIADIYRKIGKYGFISMDVLEKKDKDSFEMKAGIDWERGYVDPTYAGDYLDGKIIYDHKPKIIISNSNLTYDDLEIMLAPLMKTAFNQENIELVIVANDFDSDVRNFLKTNRLKHLQIGSHSVPMNFTPVDIDQVTTESKDRLEDLALLCGCKIYDKYRTKPADILINSKDYVGSAEKIVITPKKTEIIGLPEDRMSPDQLKNIDSAVKQYSKELSKLLDVEISTSEQDKKIYLLRQRISRLKNNSAIFHVAGKTLAERITRQRLIEDGVFACKSALNNGYVPGGNLCIPKILKEHKDDIKKKLVDKYSFFLIDNPNEFFDYFIDMVKDAFLESYRSVLDNSYMSEEEVSQVIKVCINENMFYNLKTHSYESWDKTNIINSVDTDVQILRSCISLISILSTSNQMLTLNLNVTDHIKP